MTLNMGPQHPSTHGVLRVVLELDGETILAARPEIGYLHTGIEKECEVKKYQQVMPLTDRVDYLSNLNNNLCYALAVETAAGLGNSAHGAVDARDAVRADAHRQPSDLAGHACAGHRRDDRLFLLLPRARRDPEDLRDVLGPADDDQLHPHRRPGAGAAARLAQSGQRLLSSELARGIDEYHNLLSQNPIWCNRTKGVGGLPLE